MKQNLRPAAILLVVALAAPAAAHAQFGGLIKKAKKAVANESPAPSGATAAGPEFTEQLLAAVLKGLNAEQRPLLERDALVKQREDATTRRSAIMDQHTRDLDAYNASVERVRACSDAVYESRDKAREKLITAKQQELLSDPSRAVAIQQASAEYAQKMQAAQARGDTAALARLQSAFYAKALGSGFDPHADTAAAVQKCGGAPKPAWLVEADGLGARADSLSDRIRGVESKMQGAGVAASGLDEQTYHVTRERLVAWVSSGKGTRGAQGFSAREAALLEAHDSEIAAVSRALRS